MVGRDRSAGLRRGRLRSWSVWSPRGRGMIWRRLLLPFLAGLGVSAWFVYRWWFFVPRDDATRGPRSLVGMGMKSFVVCTLNGKR